MKNTKPTTSPVSRSKKLSPFKSLKALLSWRTTGAPPALVKEIARAILDYAHSEEPLSIQDFRTNFGIPEGHYYNYVKKYPEIGAAHAYLKEAIGSKVHRRAADNNGSVKTLLSTLYQYHEDFKKLREDDMAEALILKNQDNENKPTTINLHHGMYTHVQDTSAEDPSAEDPSAEDPACQ